MTLPPLVAQEIRSRFGSLRIEDTVGGGCISPAFRVALGNRTAFLKYSAGASAEIFAVEALGLDVLRAAASGLRIPEVIGTSAADREPGWILLEWLEPGPRGYRFAERLGRGLAALHSAAASGWGWRRDGFIGPIEQSNQPALEWAEFWAERRLRPQLRLAVDAGRLPGERRAWDDLFRQLPTSLAAAEDDGPSLLHGDLWSGNVLAAGTAGDPALVDPAAYHGHREVDLAMTELFGGFDRVFYSAYEEAHPLLPGYRPGRRAVYQLFYLLVHVNLFGESYRARTVDALRTALAAV